MFNMSNQYYRVLGIDFGDKHIGLALSDLTGTIANGLNTLDRKNVQYDINYIVNLIQQNQVQVIVFGLPINMDGTMGDRVQKTYDFANLLAQQTTAKIEYLDERLTTAVAEKVLISADVSRAKRKTVIDKLAATIILQDFLNAHKRS